MKTGNIAKRVTRLGLLAAVSIILMYTVRAQWPLAPFLVYDPADVPILIGAFLYGPWYGVLLTAYRFNRTKKGAVKALIAGGLTMVLLMVAMNLIITPLYMNAPVKVVVDLLLPAIIPFNVLKAGLNGLLTFLLYKRVEKFFVV